MTAFCWIVFGLGLFLQPGVAIIKRYGTLDDETFTRFIFELSIEEWARLGAQVAFGSVCMIFGWMKLVA